MKLITIIIIGIILIGGLVFLHNKYPNLYGKRFSEKEFNEKSHIFNWDKIETEPTTQVGYKTEGQIYGDSNIYIEDKK